MKYQLWVSLHPVGCCFLYAVKEVGVEDHGHTYEYQALYAGMCGLRSPLLLPVRWRHESEKTLVSPGYWWIKTLRLMGNPKLDFIELIHIIAVGGARKVGA